MNEVRVRQEWWVREAARAAVVASLVAPAIGCQSGSWMAKPSWMTFGQKADDAGKLSAAPAFAGDVQKPSATAKPYPTTSTPESYTLPDATAQAAAAPGATPAAVTYGSTPPPAAAMPAPTAAGPVAPQVGPYAASIPPAGTLPPETSPTGPQPASAWSSPPLAAVPPQALPSEPVPAISTAAPPWAAGAAATPGPTAPPERFADARAASPAWTPAPLEPAAAPVQSMDGRYASTGTSRFGGAGAASAAPVAASLLPAAAPAAFPGPQTEALPASLPPAYSAPPAAPAAPTRRPDPAYRPGGTSSYRPARSSLAAEPASGVQPASFDVAN